MEFKFNLCAYLAIYGRNFSWEKLIIGGERKKVNNLDSKVNFSFPFFLLTRKILFFHFFSLLF